MPLLDISVSGIKERDKGLETLAAVAGDLRPFWADLAVDLARTSQARWPLRRRTGRLRKSLTWRGESLGVGGVFEPTPDRLTFGSAVFYGRFHQEGARNVPRRELIHVDPARHRAALAAWLVSRAQRAGLEVPP